MSLLNRQISMSKGGEKPLPAPGGGGSEPIASQALWEFSMGTLQSILEKRGWHNILWRSSYSLLFMQYRNCHSLVVPLLYAYGPPDSGRLLRVYVCREPKLTMPALTDIGHLTQATQPPGCPAGRPTDVIVLFSSKITTLPDPSSFSFNLEPMLLQLLSFDITEYAGIGTPHMMTDSEARDFEARYGKPGGFPSIVVTEPIVRFHDYPIGALLIFKYPTRTSVRRVSVGNPRNKYEQYFFLRTETPRLFGGD